MELRAYWRVIRRYLPLILGLPLLVGLAYPLLSTPPPPAYAAGMRFVVGIQPEEPPDDQYTYDRYYTWLTAEYLIDDLSEVVKSRRFAEDVETRRLGPSRAPSGHRRRCCTASCRSPSPARSRKRNPAAATENSDQRCGPLLSQLATESAVISPSTRPRSTPWAALRDRLDLPLRPAGPRCGAGPSFLTT